MFICFFALWIVLNGRWTTEIAVFGLVFAVLAYAFTWKYMGYSPKVDLALLLRLPSAIRYGFVLVREIVKANLAVAGMILKKDFEPQPQLVHFDVPLQKNRHRVALANSITLTPGTISVELNEADLWVHALDASMVEGLDDGVFVQALCRMEKRLKAKAAQTEAEAEAPAEAESAVQEQESERTAEDTGVNGETEAPEEAGAATETEERKETEEESHEH